MSKKYSIVLIWKFCSYIHCYYVYTVETIKIDFFFAMYKWTPNPHY
jgi:hypothetical protein